eukprot:GHVO01006498.1.p1 GENE.GHVO01006498.1~~GHVO01006498.1.p1  ORF type:complete len:374 (+),score=46.66 GHVO01006498.1:49-1122(+)
MGKIGAKSAAFINHKPFHPGKLQNIEKVWIAQEKEKKEKQGQEELLERRQQEVRIEELRKALRQSEGNTSLEGQYTLASEGMEWMYENPAQMAREREQEEFRLGKKIETTTESSDAQTIKAMEKAPGTLFVNSVNKKEDTLRKMREDPLFAIRQAENQRKREIESNPFLKLANTVVQPEKVDAKRRERSRSPEHSRAARRSPEQTRRSPKRGTRSYRNRSRSNDQQRDRGTDRYRDRNSDNHRYRSDNSRHADHSRSNSDHQSRGRPQRQQMTDEERMKRISEMEEAGREHEGNKNVRIAALELKNRCENRADEIQRKAKGGTKLVNKFEKAAYENMTLEKRLQQRAGRLQKIDSFA